MAYQTTDARGRVWQTLLTANDSTCVEGTENLGATRELSDGRRFRYIKMTGADGSLGEVLMPATKVAVTGVSAGSTTTGPDGATTTLITDADATWTTDAYIGWYFQVVTGGTGSTEPLKIVGNTKTTLTLEKSLATPVILNDDGEILAGNVAGVSTTSGDLSMPTVGVCIGTITENYYGWVQTGGVAAVQSDAITEFVTVSPGGNAGGDAVAYNAAGDNIIGICMAASGTDQNCMVDLKIA
jgi:hypothetical protein